MSVLACVNTPSIISIAYSIIYTNICNVVIALLRPGRDCCMEQRLHREAYTDSKAQASLWTTQISHLTWPCFKSDCSSEYAFRYQRVRNKVSTKWRSEELCSECSAVRYQRVQTLLANPFLVLYDQRVGPLWRCRGEVVHRLWTSYTVH